MRRVFPVHQAIYPEAERQHTQPTTPQLLQNATEDSPEAKRQRAKPSTLQLLQNATEGSSFFTSLSFDARNEIFSYMNLPPLACKSSAKEWAGMVLTCRQAKKEIEEFVVRKLSALFVDLNKSYQGVHPGNMELTIPTFPAVLPLPRKLIITIDATFTMPDLDKICSLHLDELRIHVIGTGAEMLTIEQINRTTVRKKCQKVFWKLCAANDRTRRSCAGFIRKSLVTWDFSKDLKFTEPILPRDSNILGWIWEVDPVLRSFKLIFADRLGHSRITPDADLPYFIEATRGRGSIGAQGFQLLRNPMCWSFTSRCDTFFGKIEGVEPDSIGARARTAGGLKPITQAIWPEQILTLEANYDNKKPYRLIFDLHWLDGVYTDVANGGVIKPYYGMPELINDTASIIYVAPNGRNQGWANADGQDMTFIQQVVKVTSNELCIDETLRFNIGFSYGDAMLYSIACTLAKDFRALAALSGGQLSQCMGGNDSIAYYHQHGINDQVLPIAGARQMRDRFVKTWCKG